MKIAICDDEVAVSEVTKSLLQQWAIHQSISLSVHCYENGDALILAQKSECFDLIFLDVLMPLLNGIDTAKELRRQNQNVPIIFLTSSKEFAFDSYEVKALQYLLKPVSPNQLWSIMDDFMALIKKSERNLCCPHFGRILQNRTGRYKLFRSSKQIRSCFSS